MKHTIKFLAIFFLMLAIGCTKSDYELGSSDKKSSGERNSNSGNQGGKAGVVTAAEWNDLNKWEFWNNLLNKKDFSDKVSYWDFYTNHRISVSLINKDNNQPFVDASLELKRSEKTIWETRTDNLGKAELWVSLFQKEENVNSDKLTLWANGVKISESVKLFKDGINEIKINETEKKMIPINIELAFVIDATGSMGDELEFLKKDLKSVIQKVQENNSAAKISTGTVFYRDQGDEYVVKHSGFTKNINETLSFIKQQKASGGGDYPEAVHTALNTALNELQWSSVAKTRILFLLLDAPPHHKPEIIKEIHESTKKAAQKGIKIIPITASGIDKNTEFLMRFMAIATNGTYVFITDDSGVGNKHLEPSVGEYQVELLNALMVRLVTKYTE